MSRFQRTREALAGNGWQSSWLPFDDAHRKYGPTLLPKVTPAGRQSVLDRLCVTVEAWTADDITILFATSDADTLLDTVVWQTGQPAIVTPSLNMILQIAASRTLDTSGPGSGDALRVA